MKKLMSLALVFLFASCSVGKQSSSNLPTDRTRAIVHDSDQVVEVTFLQLNDVYEIAPVENGKYGGMARVATVRAKLRKENPNTFTILSGDFISPSALGTSFYQGKRIYGAQMVDVMNSIGVDFVTFGNHEFDLGYEALQSRIDESQFTWISSNIKYTPSEEGYVRAFQKTVNGKSEPVPESYILHVRNAKGKELRIGIVGLTIGSNRPAYTVWTDPIETAKRVCADLRQTTDMIIAITHLSIEEDKKLAEALPELKLILGGHEHTNMMFKVGETIISKADANARTAFIHRLRWFASTKSLDILSEVKTIDNTIPDEPATANIVNTWLTRAFDGFREKGFDPNEVVATLKEPLDGREVTIRYHQTNLGTLVASAMLKAAKKSRIAIFNSGSIRLDDQLSGTITQYDIIRTLPFGGKILEVEMKGGLLKQVLDAGMANKGRGGFLQYAGVSFDSVSNNWSIGGKQIDPRDQLSVIVSDYVFSGNEHGLEFFSRKHSDVIAVHEPSDANDPRRDIRLGVIAYLRNQ